MSLTVRVLIALAAGILLGGLLPLVGGVVQAGATATAEVVGGLWLDALRMTVVPLVFSLIVTGTASAAGTAAAGGAAARALAWFAALLVFGIVYSFIVSPALLAAFPMPTGASGLLGAGEPPGAVEAPTLAQQIRAIVPTNPIAAAASDAMLPLVVFAAVFGFAASRLDDERRARLTGLFDAVEKAMLRIVEWVLLAAPIGVFALAVVVGAQAGAAAAGALAHYVTIVSAVQVGAILLLYPLVAFAARMPFGRFVRAAVPPQAVAASTQSSLATLPAMVEASVRDMRVREDIAGLVLPLAVSIFRYTSPIANLAVTVYVARLFGIELTLPQMVAGGAVAFMVAVGSVGVPGQTSFITSLTPMSLAMGLPLELLPLLLAVEVVPDIFRTIGNVTADLAVTAIVAGDELEPGEAPQSLASGPTSPPA